MKHTPKAVLIGLSGATATLVEKYLQAGRLPNLAAMIRRGRRNPGSDCGSAHAVPGERPAVAGEERGAGAEGLGGGMRMRQNSGAERTTFVNRSSTVRSHPPVT